jgi:hypothetical protein
MFNKINKHLLNWNFIIQKYKTMFKILNFNQNNYEIYI